MYTHKEIEDLSEGEGQGGDGEHDQRSSFAEDLEDDKDFEGEIYDETDKREEEIQDVECEIFEIRGGGMEGSRPSEASVGGDEAHADKEYQRRAKDELRVRKGQRWKGNYPH